MQLEESELIRVGVLEGMSKQAVQTGMVESGSYRFALRFSSLGAEFRRRGLGVRYQL